MTNEATENLKNSGKVQFKLILSTTNKPMTASLMAKIGSPLLACVSVLGNEVATCIVKKSLSKYVMYLQMKRFVILGVG